jgi:acyl-CoA reductase-like NAD-dependent aldehyde dehydrogenase
MGLNTPLGGFKESGIGRELGTEGLRAFQETRVIAVPDSSLLGVDPQDAIV